MDQKSAGFKENEHTADWELEAWAPNLAALLEQAARGMVRLAGMQLKSTPRVSRRLDIQAEDPESLLVRFLSEILYLGEQEGLGFDQYSIELDGYRLKANLIGAPIASIAKDIKAVTYHNLSIQTSARGLEACIVFDV